VVVSAPPVGRSQTSLDPDLEFGPAEGSNLASCPPHLCVEQTDHISGLAFHVLVPDVAVLALRDLLPMLPARQACRLHPHQSETPYDSGLSLSWCLSCAAAPLLYLSVVVCLRLTRIRTHTIEDR